MDFGEFAGGEMSTDDLLNSYLQNDNIDIFNDNSVVNLMTAAVTAGTSGGGGVLSLPPPPPPPPVHSAPLPLPPPPPPMMENFVGMSYAGENFSLGNHFDPSASSSAAAAVFCDDSNDNAADTRSSKRKKYNRHTGIQIQELEAAFKENPHPDEKTRIELGQRLSLEVRQVKFWFQNRRTQMKTQIERHENSILKQENDKLRLENLAMKEAMRNPVCQTCGGPAILGDVPAEHHQLLIENARLKDELSRLGLLAGNFLNKRGSTSASQNFNSPAAGLLQAVVPAAGIQPEMVPDGGVNPTLPQLPLEYGDISTDDYFQVFTPEIGPAAAPPPNVASNFDKTLFLELALTAMDELLKLSEMHNLWYDSFELNGETLNIDEYVKAFTPCIGAKPGHFVTDGTRGTCMSIFKGSVIAKTLMDLKQWTQMFPCTIGTNSVLDVISHGNGGNLDGALQLIQAEFQALSPMIPLRPMKFIRFCKRYRTDTWAIVDVSVDTLFHDMRGNTALVCRRLPSGCIVQDMPDGDSKVTWIEHTEYDEGIIHHLFRPFVRSGLAFGAQKWVSYLQRQCEQFNALMFPIETPPAFPADGKKNIIKLAQRIVRSFSTSVCATGHPWEVIEISDSVKLLARASHGIDGDPLGVIVSATTTVWLPVVNETLLEFLLKEETREQWDVLAQDGPMERIFQFPKSCKPGNSLALHRTAVPAGNPNRKAMVVLQDMYTDGTGSVIVHSAIEEDRVVEVMAGADSSAMGILPSGFAIMPDCMNRAGSDVESGTFMTVGFQILVNNVPTGVVPPQSIATVKNLIARTLQGVRNGINCR
ncbi:homeobox-leucine zipper protein ROC5-like [Andrographis paniculata]|uniref:homeobox-leucine zipper protein ROC5-like n=1 Tax=Andrographis paniculata TaxID=175694 RepID=UPI0021E84F6B|nr:homeobox-leucine zipper protein ROC5-like [Andrographis paniculata]